MSVEAQDALNRIQEQLAEQTRAMLYLQTMYYRLLKINLKDDFEKVAPHYNDGVMGKKFSGQLLEIEHLVYLIGYMYWIILNKGIEDASRIFGNISILSLSLGQTNPEQYYSSIGFSS